MFVRVWEYDVAEGREADFERIYAADGDWAGLFAASDGYLGTELFSCIGAPRKYITVDRFTSSAAWERFPAEHGNAYAEMDHRVDGITLDEQELAASERG